MESRPDNYAPNEELGTHEPTSPPQAAAEALPTEPQSAGHMLPSAAIAAQDSANGHTPHPSTPDGHGNGHMPGAPEAAGETGHEGAHRGEGGAGHSRDRFKTVLALLMALVVVSGAIITWRSTLDAEEATKEDTLGITAAVQAQGAQVQSSVNAYQDYQAFTSYVRNQAVANLLSQEIHTLSTGQDANNPDTQAQIAALQQSMTESNDVANATRKYFQSRYISPDGTYNLNAEISASLADQAQSTDFAADKHFEEAVNLRTKSNDFLLALLTMGGALVCFTLASGPAQRYRVLLAVIGVLLTLFALGDAVRVEFIS